ncbi:MAG TPA: DMT family transporter [Acidobacteriota bacterium]|nr:DMT family transporter [Acidobacteriota bacterium]HNR39736.1 DMT family transporter [Acidobacteriota bacterium]HNU01226.1 DMT family transporter [Acidobacteriota bacterium]HPB29326.1 DMT family transporter [Acidobacteriota bacterium]HQO26933.1 DMT family transporter [Acidobacteriota bacterium]
MISERSNLARGFPLAIASAAILSTTAIFIRYLTLNYALAPLALAFWRDLFVVAALAPALALAAPRRLRVGRGDIAFLAGWGLVLAVFNAFWTLSVAANGAAVATVLVYSSAAFTVLLGWRLLGERLDWARLLAVAATLTGCALVSGAADPAAWRAQLGGILLGLLSGLGYAAHSLMGRSSSRRGLDPWTALLYIFGFATLFLLVINLTPGAAAVGGAARSAHLFALGDAWAGWGVLVLLAVGPTVAGFGLYNVSLTYLPSGIVNLIATLEPPFTAAIAYVLLGERLTLPQAAGGALVVAVVAGLRVWEGWLAGRDRRAAPCAPGAASAE